MQDQELNLEKVPLVRGSLMTETHTLTQLRAQVSIALIPNIKINQLIKQTATRNVKFTLTCSLSIIREYKLYEHVLRHITSMIQKSSQSIHEGYKAETDSDQI